MLISSIFVASLFFPAVYFIKFHVTPMYCALALITAVLAVLAVIALFKGIIFLIQYRYCKAFDNVHEEIMTLLDQRLFLSEEDISSICQISNPKIIARYPRLVKQILQEEIDKSVLKLVTINDTPVYTTKDPKKLKKEYFKKISIFNKTDLTVLGIGTGLLLIKSLIAVPKIAQKLGFGKGYSSSQRLEHNADSIIKAEQNSLKRYINNHNGMTNEAKKILSSKSVPFDVTKGSRSAGVNLGGANHRFATLGHDPILGYFFGVINILTNTITTNTFCTFRVEDNIIKPEEILFGDIFKEALEIISKNPDCLWAALKKEHVHLMSDVHSKKSLPLPGTELIPHSFAEKMYKNHIDFFNLMNGIRDIGFVVTSALVSEFIDIIIEAIHELTFDLETENKELFDIRTKIIVMTANNIAMISNALLALITRNLQVIDYGGLLISVWKTYTATNAVFGTYWNLKYDPTDTPEIQNEIAKYDRAKQELNTCL